MEVGSIEVGYRLRNNNIIIVRTGGTVSVRSVL